VSAARIDSSSVQALVAMQRPDSRSMSIDRPMQPSITVIAGMTSSATYRMPGSMSDTRAWNVVERACTAIASRHGGTTPAPPDSATLPPIAGAGNASAQGSGSRAKN